MCFFNLFVIVINCMWTICICKKKLRFDNHQIPLQAQIWEVKLFDLADVRSLDPPLGQSTLMLRLALHRALSTTTTIANCSTRFVSSLASKPSLSIWRRKKELGKEGLIIAKELKRLQPNPVRVDRFVKSNVSRLLKSDLVAVLAEFQRQDNVFLSMKLYSIVRKEIWYRPDMFSYRDMLMMLARNKSVDEAMSVWDDLKCEEVLFDQHTFGDIIRAFLDSGLPSVAMDIYEEMRQSPEPPLLLPFRVILKGLIPYPELREKVKDDLDIFPDMIIYDHPEDLFDDHEKHKDEVSDDSC